jgi:hypothetical protein
MTEVRKQIDELTLECLMSKDQFSKYKKLKPTLNKKEQKFYKRRIFDLTRKLLNNEKPEQMFPDIKGAFESYSKTCIEYFKALDKSDIIQEEYSSLDEKNTIISSPCLETLEQANHIIMRSIKLNQPNSLEKMVKRKPITTIKAEKPQVIPQQKNINLRDPSFKNKGIAKKKNLDTIYEEEQENE